VLPVVYDLAPGDVLRIGDAVTLTVVAVEGDLIRFTVASPGGECPDVDLGGPQPGTEHGWWRLN
jgi:hypothetical protein